MGIAAGLYLNLQWEKNYSKIWIMDTQRNIIEDIKDLGKLKSPNILVVFIDLF